MPRRSEKVVDISINNLNLLDDKQLQKSSEMHC